MKKVLLIAAAAALLVLSGFLLVDYPDEMKTMFLYRNTESEVAPDVPVIDEIDTKITFDTVFMGPLFSQMSNQQRVNKILQNINDFGAGPGGASGHHIRDCKYCDLRRDDTLEDQIKRMESPVIHESVTYGNELRIYDGEVNFDFRSFAGQSVPFEGHVSGGIKEIRFNGQEVLFKENADLFFRQNLNLHPGYNKIPLRIKGKSGVETEWWVVIDTGIN